MTTNVQLRNIIMIILNTLRHKSMSRPTSTDCGIAGFLCTLMTLLLLASCSLQPADYPTPDEPTADSDRLIVLCEGLWGMDNSSLSLIDHGVLTNRWFQQQNPGRHLGDTGNDILHINDTLIAISVNWSNIIQYIRPDGTAIAATENIPNNRRLATDGKGFLYVT